MTKGQGNQSKKRGRERKRKTCKVEVELHTGRRETRTQRTSAAQQQVLTNSVTGTHWADVGMTSRGLTRHSHQQSGNYGKTDRKQKKKNNKLQSKSHKYGHQTRCTRQMEQKGWKQKHSVRQRKA